METTPCPGTSSVSGPDSPIAMARGVDRALEGAPVVEIDDGKGNRAEEVSHEDHVGPAEVDEAVPVRMRRRHGEDRRLLPVQVEGHVSTVREYGKREGGPRLRQADADLVPGKDRHAHPPEVLVPADVVAVDVRVDQEADLTRGELPNGRYDPLRERGELVVDHHDPVLSDRESDVSALSLEVVDASPDLVRHDLHVVHVLLSPRLGRGEDRERSEKRNQAVQW